MSKDYSWDYMRYHSVKFNTNEFLRTPSNTIVDCKHWHGSGLCLECKTIQLQYYNSFAITTSMKSCKSNREPMPTHTHPYHRRLCDRTSPNLFLPLPLRSTPSQMFGCCLLLMISCVDVMCVVLGAERGWTCNFSFLCGVWCVGCVHLSEPPLSGVHNI